MFNKQNDEMAVNAIRVLSMETVQKANSGHPGMAMGSAPIAFELWANQMKHNPHNQNWINRDRFVLSAGHASALLYSLLYLFDYGLTIDDLQHFRQWGSKTPGHPEYGHTVGVEATTGPLGQGVAMAVGMAMAEAQLSARFNQDDINIIDHYTFALVGDGCMMEGVSSEASSLAGTQQLGKLIVLYDSNNITIEGSTDVAFQENVAKRYEAYGWQVLEVSDGNDLSAIGYAIKKAKRRLDQPSLIIVKTKIASGSPLEGQAKTHGEPLGEDNIRLTKDKLGWPSIPDFTIPEATRNYYDKIVTKLEKENSDWDKLLATYKEKYPSYYELLMQHMNQEEPDLLNDADFWKYDGTQATRATSGEALNRLNKRVPNLFGGSADLGPSNKSELKDETWFSPENRNGKNIHFGVREFAMACAANGIALHGGLRPFCATFFVFSDYQKAAIRLTALMGIKVTYLLTHDSIGVGEDGPTHEPIEQLSMLRAIPNTVVFRPADGKETAAAYAASLKHNGPTCIVTTRQNLPTYEKSGPDALKGGYILSNCDGTPDILLMASGSEVEQIMQAQKLLAQDNIQARIISMPSMELFEQQSDEYKESVLPAAISARVAMEAGATMSWYRYVGLNGTVIGLDHFGASAPAPILFEKFGFTADNVVATAKKVLGK